MNANFSNVRVQIEVFRNANFSNVLVQIQVGVELVFTLD